jgi:hypothetical protein
VHCPRVRRPRKHTTLVQRARSSQLLKQIRQRAWYIFRQRGVVGLSQRCSDIIIGPALYAARPLRSMRRGGNGLLRARCLAISLYLTQTTPPGQRDWPTIRCALKIATPTLR